MTTNTWNDSNGDHKWSTDANWSLSHKPLVTEDVTFDHAVSDGNCTIDEDGVGKTLTTVAGYLGVISHAANCDVTVGDVNLQAGTVTGLVSAVWYVSGNFTKGAGATVGGNLNLTLSGTNKTYLSNNVLAIYKLVVTGSYTFNWSVDAYYNFDNQGTITVATSMFLRWQSYNGGTFLNTGVIQGAGLLVILIYTADKTITFGVINCPTAIFEMHATNSQAVTLGADTVFGSALYVYSTGTGTCSLIAGASNRKLTVAGLTTLVARGCVASGTDKWIFQGGYAQTGASSTAAFAGDVDFGTSMVKTAGTMTFNGTGDQYIDGCADVPVVINKAGGTAIFRYGQITDGNVTVTAGSYRIEKRSVAQKRWWWYKA